MIWFRNATVWAPQAQGTTDVLVAGGKIAHVGSLSSPPGDWPIEVVDLQGNHLIPGLVDVHAHVGGGGGEGGGAHTRVPAPALTTFTTAGVTTVVGLLGTDSTTRSLQDLLAAARALSHHGLTAYTYTGAYRVPPPTVTGSVRGDIVHIDRVVGVGELAISDHRSSQPTFDELARIASDCHAAGLMTGKAGLLHLHLGDGPRGLELVKRLLDETELPPRCLHPTHLNRNAALWSETMAAAASHRIYADVTAFPPDPRDISAAEAIALWFQAGLPTDRITMSSDGGGCIPEFDTDGNVVRMGVGTPHHLLSNVRDLVTRGVSLDNALRPVTINPAALYRFHNKGRIAAGADADLVVLDGHLNLKHTVAGGQFLVRNGEPVVRGMFEAPSS
jgi:beta-aspartyl-dipeptidase (metallo-type)